MRYVMKRYHNIWCNKITKQRNILSYLVWKIVTFRIFHKMIWVFFCSFHGNHIILIYLRYIFWITIYFQNFLLDFQLNVIDLTFNNFSKWQWKLTFFTLSQQQSYACMCLSILHVWKCRIYYLYNISKKNVFKRS